jgi:hypothetical protein
VNLKDPLNTTLLIVGWNIHRIISNLKISPYPAVCLRKIGLKHIKFRNRKPQFKSDITVSYLKQRNEVLDLRVTTDKNDPLYEWWYDVYEITDKPKFFLARIKLGF